MKNTIIIHLKDNIYRLVDTNSEKTILQGTLEEINAYISLLDKGYEI